MFRPFFSSLIAVAFMLLIVPTVNAQDRWILAGDSIQAMVYGNEEFGLPGGDAAQLTAAIIMQKTGVSIQNISSPGAMMTGSGLHQQTGAVAYIHGVLHAKGIIIALGVNDAIYGADPNVYYQNYTSFVTFALSLGLEVVCVPPLSEPNEPIDVNNPRYHFQVLTVYACQNAGVPKENIFNPAAVGIFPDPAVPKQRKLFTNQKNVYDYVHLSSAGHALFAEKLIDFMVARGFWKRK